MAAICRIFLPEVAVYPLSWCHWSTIHQPRSTSTQCKNSLNYQRQFSNQMMAVVDATYQFRHVSGGAKGRASDLPQVRFKGHTWLWPPQLSFCNYSCPLYVLGEWCIPSPLWPIKPFSFCQMDHDRKVFYYRLSWAHKFLQMVLAFLPTSGEYLEPQLCFTMTW